MSDSTDKTGKVGQLKPIGSYGNRSFYPTNVDPEKFRIYQPTEEDVKAIAEATSLRREGGNNRGR